MRQKKKKKAIALYETRMSARYVILTAVCYFFAAVIWYILCVITPYMDSVPVSAAEAELLTREAFSATAEQIAKDESKKERAMLMPSCVDSFYRRLRLIEDAEEYIDYMVYDNYEQEFTFIYYAALLRAADRGVKVRIIVDGKMGTFVDTLEELGSLLCNHNNITLYHFNGLNVLKPAGLMVLMHDKVTIVDGNKLIVGGANMGTVSFTANYDMEVMITNSGADGCAGQAERYFNEMVANDLCVKKTTKKCDFSAKQKYINKFLDFFYTYHFKEPIEYETQGVAVDKITFLSNRIDGGKKPPTILTAVFNLAESSQKTVIVTPYTLLVDKKIKQLRSIAAKNAEFTIVTNSLYNSRNVGYAVYHHSRTDYIDKNIDLWEYQAKNQLHAKMFTFDDRFSVIGSFNLDERSAHVDTESVLIIDSKAFNAQVNAYINDVFIENSLKVGENNEYLPSDKVEAHPVPAVKKLKYALYNLLKVVMNVL
ncbi:MAG: phospholipase D-like domain-containing protein [Roseburia sp.]|nr:phospholipase D-like domain-containing protein [Roseburia sp.]